MEIGRKEIMPTHSILSEKIALCAIGRLENRYAREFVEHYQSIGFDKIYICDNNHEGEERFEDVITDFIESGFVEVIDYRNIVGIQRKSYDDIYNKYGELYGWMAFFDFDEFLTITEGYDIHELMKRYDEFDCVLFNWQCYGDNGLLRDDGRKLSERFTHPLPFGIIVQRPGTPENNYAKCMIKGGIQGVSFSASPHIPYEPVLRCCNSQALPCRQKPILSYNFSVAYLKHYATKTVEEWSANKWYKGTGNKESIEAFRSRYAGRFFGYNKWTQEKEDIMRELTGMPPYKSTKTNDVVIVNYDTQRLTDCTIKSLNKHTPGCKIYVFDNSDKEPFVNTFDNVEVFDNTNGQLVDFQEMLDYCPRKVPTPENNWASAKHCRSVDRCFDLLPEGFMLMDSDILIKQDISELFDSSCAWVGQIQMHASKFNVTLPRVLPYLSYINVPMCRKFGIRYFNIDWMFALTDKKPNVGYDTGCWFYEECSRFALPERHVRISNYMLHFTHGSWNAVNEEEWLDENRNLWDDTK